MKLYDNIGSLRLLNVRIYLDDVNVLIENDYSDRERFVFIYRD